MSTVHLWGIDWLCVFSTDGQLLVVKVNGRMVEAREALRDSLCDALERAHAEVTA